MSATQIHPTAIVDPAAQLDEGVTIGAYSLVGPHVRIGAGTVVGPHCVIEGRTTIGRDNRFYQFASIGAMPQDMSHGGEVTELHIGDRNTIREFVTFNTGTFKEQGITRVGNDNWIMAYVHFAHDVQVGDHTVMANGVTLAGHVHVGDWAVIGGLSGILQFVHVGAHAMVGFQAHVSQDVPPYMTADGNPLALRALNLTGLKRRDFSAERIAAIKEMHRALYRDGLTLAQAVERITAMKGQADGAADAEVQVMLDFLAASKRGIVPLNPAAAVVPSPMNALTTPTPSPRLGMVAGETSGDLLAGLLLAGMKQRWPGLVAGGIGGPRMQAEGFDAWVPSERLAVFGYVDALKRLHELLAIRRRVGNRLLAERPDVFVGIDAPDFNFGLERRLRDGGLKTVHFVCPSIWAWRPERVETIRAAAHHVLCLFPFEPALLRANGIAATYVGHPLADAIPLDPPRAAAREALGLGADDIVVALLPGSRRSEIDHLASRFAQAAVRMRAARPGLVFVLPAVPAQRERVRRIVDRDAPGAGIRVLEGRSHEALAACDVTLVASGTATLEAALFKRPMVIAYALHWLNHRRMRRLALQPWVGLPNVLCGEFVVPELIQDAATPEALARETLAWLDDGARTARTRARFDELHHLLRQDTARQSAHAIAEVLAGR